MASPSRAGGIWCAHTQRAETVTHSNPSASVQTDQVKVEGTEVKVLL